MGSMNTVGVHHHMHIFTEFLGLKNVLATERRYTLTKTCLKRSHKNRQTKILKTNGSLMKVESIEECSLGAFCNTFDMH